MPTHRKQFGKRGLTPEVGQRWGQATTAAAAPAYGAAYSAPGYGAQAIEDEDKFSIVKAFLFPLGLFFSFYGRLSRKEYWVLGFIRWFASLAVLAFYRSAQGAEIELFLARMDSIPADQVLGATLHAFYGSTAGIVCIFFSIALTVSLYSLEARRCHDRDVSGFWLFLLLVPGVNLLFALYLFIANGFFKGTPGPNRFDTGVSQAAVFD